MMEWIQKVVDIIKSIGNFFVMMWNDEDRWWYIAGLLVVLIGIYKIIIGPLISMFNDTYSYSSITERKTKRHISPAMNNTRTVTIKGVYQMNGPKPFERVIRCSSSETGYYSQLMGNKSKQAQWIKTHFPGANTSRGFSMTVNIK